MPTENRRAGTTSTGVLGMIRILLREGGRHEVIHLWKSSRMAECGKQFESIVGTWRDDDRKVTCRECRVVRDMWYSDTKRFGFQA